MKKIVIRKSNKTRTRLLILTLAGTSTLIAFVMFAFVSVRHIESLNAENAKLRQQIEQLQ